MKYVKYQGTLYSMSDRLWRDYCKDMAKGEELEIPGKLLEYEIIDITTWEREDFAKAIGLKEVPLDLPTKPTLPIRQGRNSNKRSHGSRKDTRQRL